jgi:uncharacterized protein YcgL (UPF0745 family)
VFRSTRREGTYLYVERGTDLATLPPALLKVFGAPESVLTFKLHEQRKLAQAIASEVLQAIAAQGFYLQTPRGEDADGGIGQSADHREGT